MKLVRWRWVDFQPDAVEYTLQWILVDSSLHDRDAAGVPWGEFLCDTHQLRGILQWKESPLHNRYGPGLED